MAISERLMACGDCKSSLGWPFLCIRYPWIAFLSIHKGGLKLSLPPTSPYKARRAAFAGCGKNFLADITEGPCGASEGPLELCLPLSVSYISPKVQAAGRG